MAIDDKIEEPTGAAEQHEVATEEEVARTWRPSRPAAHRFDQVAGETSGEIVERAEGGGLLGATARFLKRPFVRLIVGVSGFILAALLYDQFVNGGSWTIRAEKPKPAKHAGSEPIPKTPD